MKIEKETMEILTPYFQKKEINCAKIAMETQIPHGQVLSYFSAWLRKMTKHSEAAKVDDHFENKPPRCPTCNKLKNEVTDMAVCRDVFHYL